MSLDMSHLHTTDDIARARLVLMDFREHNQDDNGPEVKLVAAQLEHAITTRAVQLGLEPP